MGVEVGVEAVVQLPKMTEQEQEPEPWCSWLGAVGTETVVEARLSMTKEQGPLCSLAPGWDQHRRSQHRWEGQLR